MDHGAARARCRQRERAGSVSQRGCEAGARRPDVHLAIVGDDAECEAVERGIQANVADRLRRSSGVARAEIPRRCAGPLRDVPESSRRT